MPEQTPWHELRNLRKTLGVGQIELSQRAGLSQSYICEMETGRKPRQAAAIYAIARALDVPPTMLGAPTTTELDLGFGDAAVAAAIEFWVKNRPRFTAAQREALRAIFDLSDVPAKAAG